MLWCSATCMYFLSPLLSDPFPRHNELKSTQPPFFSRRVLIKRASHCIFIGAPFWQAKSFYLYYSHSSHHTVLLVRFKFPANLQILSPSPSLMFFPLMHFWKDTISPLSLQAKDDCLSVALCKKDSLFLFYLITDLLDSQEQLYIIWMIRNTYNIPAVFYSRNNFFFLLPLATWLFTTPTPSSDWTPLPWLIKPKENKTIKYGWLITNDLDIYTSCISQLGVTVPHSSPTVAAAGGKVCLHGCVRPGKEEATACW